MNYKLSNSFTIKNYTNGVKCLINNYITSINTPPKDVISGYYRDLNKSYSSSVTSNNQVKYYFNYLKLVNKYLVFNGS
jgi:hypothetical protein